MRILRTVATLVALTPLMLPFACAAGKAHSIDGARSEFSTPEAKAAFDFEMSGEARDDGLGIHLPDGFTASLLQSALVPGSDPARLVLAGAKPWSARPDSFVAIVCLAHSGEEAAHMRKSDECRTESAQAWFGVFERVSGGSPRLIARTFAPIETPTDWVDSDIDVPHADDDDAVLPDNWLRFDLAAFRIKDDEPAFGVRAGWSDGYAGGSASFEALYLFRIDSNELKVVFAAPMMYFEMIAGDWNPDGTRNHDMYDASNVLNVLAAKTEGFHDLQLRQRKGAWRKTYRWSEHDGRYLPK
ncbi:MULTISPECIES: hypothetical protein [Pandoraea]|nr:MULTISPECIES: hypothetical protein [Pandoraea]